MHRKSCRPTWTNVDPEGDLLAPEKDCLTALALAHAFNARRFLDIRHDLALLQMRKALEVGFSLKQWLDVAGKPPWVFHGFTIDSYTPSITYSKL